jgi:O-antigen/teichoic acid export membrane protein
VLFVGTFLGNMLSYFFFVVLSRTLTPPDLGAVGSLVSLATIAAVPGTGIQLVAARWVAAPPPDGPPLRCLRLRCLPRLRCSPGTAALDAALGASLRLAAVLSAAALVLVPGAAYLLRVDVGAALAVATAAAPITLTFAVQGLLQGRERFGALATVAALVGITRVSAAVLAAAGDLGPDAVMWLFTAGWALTLYIAGFLLHRDGGPHLFKAARHAWGSAPSRAIFRQSVTAVLPMSGLLVLSSLDMLLARHFLPEDLSGGYAIGAVFEKVAFWGPTFLATLYYPRMARAADRLVPSEMPCSSRHPSARSVCWPPSCSGGPWSRSSAVPSMPRWHPWPGCSALSG